MDYNQLTDEELRRTEGSLRARAEVLLAQAACCFQIRAGRGAAVALRAAERAQERARTGVVLLRSSEPRIWDGLPGSPDGRKGGAVKDKVLELLALGKRLEANPGYGREYNRILRDAFPSIAAHYLALLEVAHAARPLAAFNAAMDRMPIRGLNQEDVYAIHGGEHVKPHGATLKRADLRCVAEALARADKVLEP